MGVQEEVAGARFQMFPRLLEGSVGFGKAIIDPIGVAQLGECSSTEVRYEAGPRIFLWTSVLGDACGILGQVQHPLRIAESHLVALA